MTEEANERDLEWKQKMDEILKVMWKKIEMLRLRIDQTIEEAVQRTTCVALFLLAAAPRVASIHHLSSTPVAAAADGDPNSSSLSFSDRSLYLAMWSAKAKSRADPHRASLEHRCRRLLHGYHFSSCRAISTMGNWTEFQRSPTSEVALDLVVSSHFRPVSPRRRLFWSSVLRFALGCATLQLHQPRSRRN